MSEWGVKSSKLRNYVKIFSNQNQPSVGDAGAPIFRMIPANDMDVEGGPKDRVSTEQHYVLLLHWVWITFVLHWCIGFQTPPLLMQFSGSACRHFEHQPIWESGPGTGYRYEQPGGVTALDADDANVCFLRSFPGWCRWWIGSRSTLMKQTMPA